jgi:hypothetical protein
LHIFRPEKQRQTFVFERFDHSQMLRVAQHTLPVMGFWLQCWNEMVICPAKAVGRYSAALADKACRGLIRCCYDNAGKRYAMPTYTRIGMVSAGQLSPLAYGLEQTYAGRDRHIQAADFACHGNRYQRIAMFAGQAAQAFAFGTHDNRDRSFEIGLVQ